VWNRDDSNKARVLVKLRAFDLDSIPDNIVVIQNTSAEGYGNSWSCPCYILNTHMLGAAAGDEDPLPPNGANPHPLPQLDQGFWHDDHMMHDSEATWMNELLHLVRTMLHHHMMHLLLTLHHPRMEMLHQ
jgi:hypothetical protein